MKKICILALTAIAAGVMGSCCCQEQGAPPLTPMSKFNDLNQPATPLVEESKK